MTKNLLDTKKIAILMFLAFTFSFVARLYWISYAWGIDSFYFNNQIMINTNDGYFYAEGARDLIKGSHEVGDRSAVTEPVAIVTAALYKVLPFSIETLMLYMPIVLGSLVVIPVILIARFFGQPVMGFFAAMFGAITYSYYNRTMAGYYDSDMFALIMPPFVAAFLIGYFKEKRVLWQALFLASLALSKILYPQSFAWMAATVGFTFLYALVFDRKNKQIYLTLILALVAICDLHTAAKIIVIAASLYFQSRLTLNYKSLITFAIAALVVFAYFGGLTPVIAPLNAYLFKDSLTVTSTLKYYDVVQTVQEAGKMDPNLFASRISGSMPIFIATIIGYGLFIKKEKLFALTLPIFGLGLFAYFSGLRFTVYAVPFGALGLFYLIFWGLKNLNELAKITVAALSFLIASIPNFYHIYDYKVDTVFPSGIVKQLSELGKKASREDYVFTWWDYGYPVRYYADVKNHSDGGKHDGATNFIESFILTSTSQTAAANMMRESVETYEELIKQGKEQKIATLEQMLSKNGIKNNDYNEYLAALASGTHKKSLKTRDVYLFLPYEMFGILPTIKLFSNIDLNTGAEVSSPIFFIFNNYNETEDSIDFGQALFDKKSKIVKLGYKTIHLKSVSTSYYDKTGALVTRTDSGSSTGELHLISLPTYGFYILADDEMFNSVFIQMFVFENYDKNLFEKVSSTYEAKIFRLKI